MSKQTALIRPMFFIETDVFQRLSQWEKAMMDFYAAHKVEMEKVSLIGASEGEPIYVLRNMDMVDFAQEPQADVEETSPATQMMQSAKETVKPERKRKRYLKILSRIDDKRPKSRFNPGTEMKGEVRKISIAKFSPKGT